MAAGWVSKALASVDSSSQSTSGDNLGNIIPLQATVLASHFPLAKGWTLCSNSRARPNQFQISILVRVSPETNTVAILYQGPGRKQKPHATSPGRAQYKV